MASSPFCDLRRAVLEGFLQRLTEEMAKSLPDDEVQAFVSETRDHLQESIQARLELGLDREAAERESIQAFGSAKSVGEEVRRREPRFDRAFALAAVGLLTFFAWALNVRSMSPLWFVPYVVLHLVFAGRSLRVRRPQLATFAVLLLPLWIGTAASLATQSVSYRRSGETWLDTVSREDAWGLARTMAEDGTRMRAAPERLRAGYARYLHGESDLAPVSIIVFDQRGDCKLKPQKDRSKGEARWGNALRCESLLQIGEEQIETARNIEAAAERPVWAEIPYQLGPAAERSGIIMALLAYGGSHLGLWALGKMFRSRKRRQRTAV